MAKYSNTIAYQIQTKLDATGLNQLQQQLSSVSKAFSEMAKNDSAYDQNAMKKDIARIQQVQNALSKSFNTNLNLIDLTAFKKELGGLSFGDLQETMSKTTEGAKTFNSILGTVGQIDTGFKNISSLSDKIMNTFGNTVRWGVTASIFQTIQNSLYRSVDYVKELDTSLNNIQIVTGETSSNLTEWARSANEAAAQLGASTVAFTDAAQLYAQNGYTQEDYTKLAELTTKVANVTQQSTSEVSEQITSLMAGYKMSIDEAEDSLAGMAVVAAASASDLGELAAAEQKVASAASTLGVSQDELTAQLSTIISVTREAPEQVGNSLKTIYARLGDLSLGETLEDGVSLGDVSSTLDKVGIAVLDVNGEMRSMGDILEDLMAKWQELGQAEQQALAVKLAGKYQYNNLMTLMNNSDMYYEQKEMAGSSQGALDEQQAIYMESMEAKLQTLQTKWEGVVQSVVNADSVKPFIDALSTGLDIVTDIADTIGGMGPALTLVASLVTKAFSQNMAAGITNMIMNQKRSNLLAQNEDAIISTMGGSNLNGTAATFLKNTVGNRSTLTGEQATDYNEKLQRYVQVDNQLVDAEAKVHDAISQNMETFNKYGIIINETTGNITGIGAMQLEQAEAENRGIDNIVSKLEELDNIAISTQQDVKNLGEDFTQKITMANDDVEKFESIFNDLTTKGEDGFSVFSEDLETISDRVKELFDKLKSGKGTLDDLIELRAELNDVMSSENGRKNKDVSEQKAAVADVQKAIEEARAARLASENAEENALADARSVSYQQLTQQILTVASSVGQLAFSWQSFQNLGSIWVNSDASFGEKVYQTLLSVVTVVPQMVSGAQAISSAFNQIQAALKTLDDVDMAEENLAQKKEKETQAENKNTQATTENTVAKGENKQVAGQAGDAADQESKRKDEETQAEKKNTLNTEENNAAKQQNTLVTGKGAVATGLATTAKGAETVATNLLTVATERLNAAMKANPVMFFISAITTAVSLIGAAVNAYNTAIEQALEDQKEKVEETKTSWESLSSTISTFDSAYETFKSTGEVTDSLTQSARDAADALDLEGTTALIAAGNYDKLAESIRNKKNAEAQASIETIDKNSTANNDSLAGKNIGNASTKEDFSQKVRAASSTITSNLGADYLKDLNLVGAASDNVYENITAISSNIDKLQAKMKELGSSYQEAQNAGYTGTEAQWEKETKSIQGAIDRLQEYLDLEDVKTAKDNAAAKAEIAVGRYDFQDALAEASSLEDIRKIFSGESEGKDYGTADYFNTLAQDYDEQLRYMVSNIEDANAKAKVELEQLKISFGQALFTKIKDTNTDESGKVWVDDETINETVKKTQDYLDETGLTDEQKVQLMAGIDWSESLPDIIQTIKDGVEELENQLPAIKIDTDTTKLTDAISAKDTLSSLTSQFTDESGLTEDQVADIVAENPDYLQYLTKVGDNYVLNKNALEEWNKVSEEQTKQLEAAQGKFNSAFFDDYQDSLNSAIQKTRELSEATAGQTSSDGHNYEDDADALNRMASLGLAVEEASQKLENGEISVQEYFDSFEEAFNENQIESIFKNISSYSQDTASDIMELADVLQDGLSDAMSQATKQLKNGQMSLTDYNKIVRQAAKSATKYSKELSNVEEQSENVKDAQEDVEDSTKSVNKAIENSEASDAFNEAMTENYDYLSQFMDNMANIDSGIDWGQLAHTSEMQSALGDISAGIASFVAGSQERLESFASSMGMTVDDLHNKLGIAVNDMTSNTDAMSAALLSKMTEDASFATSVVQSGMANSSAAIASMAAYAGKAIDALGTLISNFSAEIEATPTQTGMIDYPITIGDFVNIPVKIPNFKISVNSKLTGTASDAASSFLSSVKSITDIGGAMASVGMEDYKTGGSGSSIASPSSFGNTSSSGGSGGSGGGSGSSPSSGGSSGGSGNDDYSDDQTELTENEIDRYEKVNAHLDDISNNLDKVADEQDRLTGQKYIENIAQQISLLKEEVKWEEKKLEIEKQEAAEYKSILGNDYGIKFNNQGFVENYADIYNQLLAQVNEYERQYNTTTSKSAKESIQTQIDAAKKRLENFNDYIEKYDTLLTSTITESEKKIQEYYNDIEDLQIEAFNQRLDAFGNVKDFLENRADFNTNLNRLLGGDYGDEDPYYDTLNALEKIKAYWNADSEAMQEYYDTLIAKQKEILNSSTATEEEKKWAQSRIDNYIAYKEGHAGDLASSTGDGLLSMAMKDLADINEQWEQFQKTGKSDIFGENSSELLAAMKTAEENAADVIESMKDAMNDLKDSIMETIDDIGDKIDERLEKFDDINDKLDSYNDIVQSIYGDEAYDKINEVLSAQIVNGQNQVEDINKTIDTLTKLQDTMEEGSDEWNEVNDKITEAQEKLLDTTSDTLDKMAEMYENKINAALNSWTSNTALGSDLDWVSNEWELINRNADQYLDEVNSAYNIQKLQSKYLDLLDNSNQLAVQNQITDQMNQQLAYLREKDKLSQYDVDYANAQLEILQKRIALEEAQRNKSQMKLKRDNQGNYSYVYTANEDDVKSAEEDLLDADNSAYNLSKDQIKQVQDDSLSALQDAKNMLSQIWTDANLTVEQKTERTKTIIDSLKTYLLGCQDQLSTAETNIIQDFISMCDSLTDENSTNLQDVLEQLKEGNNEAFNEIDARFTTSITTWLNNLDSFAEETSKVFGEGGTIQNAIEEYQKNLEKLEEKSKVPLSNMSAAVGEVKNEMDGLANSTAQYISVLDDLSGKTATAEKALQEMNTKIQDSENSLRAFQGQYNDVSNKLVVSEREKADLQGQYAQLQKEYEDYKAQKEAEAAAAAASSGGGGGGGDDGWSPYDDAYGIWMYGDWGGGGYWYGPYAAANGEWKADQVLALFNSGYGYTWMDTGGYTGDWGPGDGMPDAKNGKMAILHSKELVLNADDTENILQAVQAVRQLTTNFRNGAFEDTVAAFNKYGSALLQNSFDSSQTVDQNVHIEATFPNVKGAEEIESALLSLTNGAIQYANRSGQF